VIESDRVEGFEWDEGNARKSVEKHDVSQAEAESVFFSNPLVVVPDPRHSQTESRYHALGRTAAGRMLHLVVTLRRQGTLIRAISARDMHRKKELFMPKKRRPIPEFASEAEEREFWESRDSTEFVDWSRAKSIRLPRLKPSTQAISLRLPVSLLERIRIEANKRDVPYQSLIKIWLSEKVG
jgi:uncharacterized DUF497 family protein/predicted DNA binding CopG/RHH family protein